MRVFAIALDFTGRVIATLLGVTMMSTAAAAELEPSALALVIERTPISAQQIIETALARENVVHAVSAALGLCGFYMTVSSWPLLVAGVILLGRTAVSAMGATLIAVAVVLALDPTFFGLFVEVPLDDEEGGGGVGVVIQSAAVLLALIGFAVTTAPWRRGE